MPASHWDGPPPRFRPPRAVVTVVPVVVSLLVQVPAAIAVAVWTHAGFWAGLGQLALAAAGPLALLAARRLPGPTVAFVALAALADLLLAPDAGPPYLALAFAIVLAVVRGALLWAAVSVGVVWLAAVLAGPALGVDWHPARIAFTTVALAACFGAGQFVRVRRSRAAEFRAAAERRRQTAEEAERLRIARELHDVLGHSLSLINVQAGVGLHLMDRDPEQARGALENIKAASKSALDEVRTVLGVLRGDEADSAPLAPQAGFAELGELVDGVRAAGLEVRLDDELAAAPPHAVQLAAYRIVQEALTNVLRHAGARRAVVRLERAGGELVVTIDDDGAGMPDAEPGGGMLGMRNRAELLGGRVDFARSPGGGARVVARLPWTEGA